ncbi:MAG: DUF3540 domain-containing protein [Desulfobacteraceae bacterium]|jgi:hypothetical protein
MLNLAEKFKRIPHTRYLGPATVVETDAETGNICISITAHPQAGYLWAQNAVPGQHRFRKDDTVLVVGENPDDLYVIGVLSQKDANESSKNKIALSKGAHAEVEGSTDEQTLMVFSPKKELLFQYDEKSGHARVNMEAGDIEFVTEKGSITFAASKDIMFHGRSIGMTGIKGVCLGVMDSLGKLRNTLTLRDRGMTIDSPELEIESERGEFNIGDTKYIGKSLKSKIDRLENIANTVITKAKNIYQTVDELSQMKAGRVRTFVAKTFHFKSKKAYVKAEEDYKINADKIHLG